uniref:Endonuclease domain-containing 1 protein-like n=1 Tax=Cyprinus carpio TaxID=7962 RepID=A0A8C2IKM8_CYPCA
MRLCIASVLAVLLALSCPFGMSEVLETFDRCSEFFLRGQPPVIPGILIPKSDHARYKKICQKYNSQDNNQRYMFATLYDTSSRIPVFSAYKYTGRGNFDRPGDLWKIEPQLDPHVGDMTVPYKNQAINEDYFANNFGMNRGHLFPSSHAADVFTAESTFTLTNIVPQYGAFNAGGWRSMEIESGDTMNTQCTDNNNKVLAHVLTGAIPGINKLNDRVNIPSSMWMAFCCYNSRRRLWVSQAYWALNKEERDDSGISRMSLEELQQILSKKWVENVQLFRNNCRDVS